MDTIVLKLTNDIIKKMKLFYAHAQLPAKNEYVSFFAKENGVSILIYTSNKVVLQGPNAKYEASIWQTNQPSIEQPSEFNLMFPMIGSDEVGTGDFFGPVLVCAAYITKEMSLKIKDYHITDSKIINDEKILKIYNELKTIIPHHTLVLSNTKFNQQTQMGLNMNVIKAKLHNHAIKKLLTIVNEPQSIIVDQFCSEKNYYQYLQNDEFVRVHLETKAEIKYIAVAVASVFARAAFLMEMDKLSKKVGVELKKGAGEYVDIQAQELYDKYGSSIFNDIAKINFKTYEKISK